MVALRVLYQDDPMRIWLDKQRIEDGTDYDVLFQDDEWKVPIEKVAKELNRVSFV